MQTQVTKTRFLKQIIDEFSEIMNLGLKTKTDWNNLHKILENDIKTIDIEKQIEKIYKKLSVQDRYFQEPKDYTTDIKTNFSITYNTQFAIGIPENNLERLIAITNNIPNQIPTCDGGHIDLCYKNNNEINIIELKQWVSNDNPFFAIIELIKNYYLFFYAQENISVRENYKLCNDANSKINLILLAPKEYYISYAKGRGFNKKVLTLFLKFIDDLNQKLKEDNIEITLKYIDIARETIENKVPYTIKDIDKGSNSRKNCDWKDYINNFTEKELLSLTNWHTIDSVEHWINLK